MSAKKYRQSRSQLVGTVVECPHPHEAIEMVAIFFMGAMLGAAIISLIIFL